MHQIVAILSGKTNEVMRQSYVLLVVRIDFNICMNRKWNVIFMDVAKCSRVAEVG